MVNLNLLAIQRTVAFFQSAPMRAKGLYSNPFYSELWHNGGIDFGDGFAPLLFALNQENLLQSLDAQINALSNRDLSKTIVMTTETQAPSYVRLANGMSVNGWVFGFTPKRWRTPVGGWFFSASCFRGIFAHYCVLQDKHVWIHLRLNTLTQGLLPVHFLQQSIGNFILKNFHTAELRNTLWLHIDF